MFLVTYFLGSSREQFIEWLNGVIVRFNRSTVNPQDMVSQIPTVRFQILADEDLEAYCYLIAHFMRKMSVEERDGTRDGFNRASEGAQAIVREHRARLEKYLEPYRGLKTDQVSLCENHRVFAATAVFTWDVR